MKRAVGASVAVYVWLLSYPLLRALELAVERVRAEHPELVDGAAAIAAVELAIASWMTDTGT